MFQNDRVSIYVYVYVYLELNNKIWMYVFIPTCLLMPQISNSRFCYPYTSLTLKNYCCYSSSYFFLLWFISCFHCSASLFRVSRIMSRISESSCSNRFVVTVLEHPFGCSISRNHAMADSSLWHLNEGFWLTDLSCVWTKKEWSCQFWGTLL